MGTFTSGDLSSPPLIDLEPLKRVIKSHLEYAGYLWTHKKHVMIEGRKLGVPLWRLLVHDWSKFLPSEWVPYVHFFNRPDLRNKVDTVRRFKQAWMHHIHLNPHHYEHWIPSSDRGGRKPLEMPEVYVREMIADWRAAGIAQGANDPLSHQWYLKFRDVIELHPKTRRLVQELMELPHEYWNAEDLYA